MDGKSTHDEGVEEDRGDEVEGSLDQAHRRGDVGVVEVRAQHLGVALKSVDYPDRIREHVLEKKKKKQSAKRQKPGRSWRQSLVLFASLAYPCDENAESTSEREERPGTGDRFALVEEHLEGRAEERKVYPCDDDVRKNMFIFIFIWGGDGGWGWGREGREKGKRKGSAP
jgi:hypothetical protein